MELIVINILHTNDMILMIYGVSRHFQQYFSYIVAVILHFQFYIIFTKKNTYFTPIYPFPQILFLVSFVVQVRTIIYTPLKLRL